MRRTIITVLALSMLLFGCGALEGEDAEALEDLLEGLEEIAESQAGSDSSQDSSGSDSSSSNSSGSNSGANTSSPNRPPPLPGGETVMSEHDELMGFSQEEITYSPLDASHDDVVDHYDEQFGDTGNRETGTSEEGDWTRWEGEGVTVVAVDTGISTDVYVFYND